MYLRQTFWPNLPNTIHKRANHGRACGLPGLLGVRQPFPVVHRPVRLLWPPKQMRVLLPPWLLVPPPLLRVPVRQPPCQLDHRLQQVGKLQLQLRLNRKNVGGAVRLLPNAVKQPPNVVPQVDGRRKGVLHQPAPLRKVKPVMLPKPDKVLKPARQVGELVRKLPLVAKLVVVV